jgi:hypothetical protein
VSRQLAEANKKENTGSKIPRGQEKLKETNKNESTKEKKKQSLNAQSHSPLCVTSLHKVIAVRDALPDPGHVIPNPSANN